MWRRGSGGKEEGWEGRDGKAADRLTGSLCKGILGMLGMGMVQLGWAVLMKCAGCAGTSAVTAADGSGPSSGAAACMPQPQPCCVLEQSPDRSLLPQAPGIICGPRHPSSTPHILAFFLCLPPLPAGSGSARLSGSVRRSATWERSARARFMQTTRLWTQMKMRSRGGGGPTGAGAAGRRQEGLGGGRTWGWEGVRCTDVVCVRWVGGFVPVSRADRKVRWSAPAGVGWVLWKAGRQCCMVTGGVDELWQMLEMRYLLARDEGWGKCCKLSACKLITHYASSS